MNITDLMKQNNKLRSQLNKDNKKYYEELLVACRIKNNTKKRIRTRNWIARNITRFNTISKTRKKFYRCFWKWYKQIIFINTCRTSKRKQSENIQVFSSLSFNINY